MKIIIHHDLYIKDFYLGLETNIYKRWRVASLFSLSFGGSWTPLICENKSAKSFNESKK